MKPLHSLIAISFFLIAGRAHADHELFSTLVFHHQDYLPLIVELDNERMGAPQTEFIFHHLEPGRHYLKVRGTNGYHHGHGYGHGYAQGIFFDGFVDIPVASTVNTILLYNNNIRYLNIIPNPVYAPVSHCAPYPAPATHCAIGMDPNRYNALKASIASRSFDSTRLLLAKEAIRNNVMSSEQIAGLTELLNFDSSRLELAKFGYRNVADPENYFLLYDLFAFDSTVRQLNDFIVRCG